MDLGTQLYLDNADVISGTGGLAIGDSKRTGTPILASASTFSGDTRIQAGTVSIARAGLNAGADVYLPVVSSSGANTIRSLYVDDWIQMGGTRVTTGSGAEHEMSRITGSGILRIGTGAKIETTYSFRQMIPNYGLLPVDCDSRYRGDGGLTGGKPPGVEPILKAPR